MGMRKTLLLAIVGGSLLIIALAPVVAGDSGRSFKASLDGYQEVLSISTPANARFTANLRGDTLTYKLRMRGFLETPLFAHIHFGRPGTNGGVSAFLCGGGGKDPCPLNGTIEGTITAANVVGPTDRGIAAGEFGELIRAMRNGSTYVNVHTPAFQPGEIRGLITRG
jgi:CHRD domain